MVTHKETVDALEPHYMVVAKLCEPDYRAEFKYLKTEIAFVERKLEERLTGLAEISVPALGFFKHKDWQKYRHSLLHYREQLEDYAEAVKHGVLPVKFAVYNASDQADKHILVRVRVEDGRFDAKKQPPSRPERLDKSGHVGKKFGLMRPRGFWRSKISQDAHMVQAEFSALGAHDGATLINTLVHVHCGPDTNVVYEIQSLNTKHESGDVEF